jgi:tRNA(Ile)-lysidine synthase
MPASRGRYRRPLLGVGRAAMRAACEAQGLPLWDDPHNTDPAFTRVRVRHQVLPVLEAALGPGVAQALARTAGQLRSDAEALDEIAARCAPGIRDADGCWHAGLLAAEHPAIRSRLLRDAATGAGCPPGALTARHIEALDALVTHWHGQRWADLPGGVRVKRQYGKLIFTVSSRDAGPGSAGPGNAEPGPGEAEVMVGS